MRVLGGDGGELYYAALFCREGRAAGGFRLFVGGPGTVLLFRVNG